MLYCRIYVDSIAVSVFVLRQAGFSSHASCAHLQITPIFCFGNMYITKVQNLESIEKCAHVKHTSHMGRSYAKHLSLSLMTLRLDTHVFLDGEGHDQR